MNWDILLKYINNESSLAENREVEDWLDEQNEHRHLLNYLQKRKEQLTQPLKQSDIHDQWVILLDRIFEQQKAGSSPRRLNYYWFAGVAASLLIVSFLGWFYVASNKKQNSYQLVTLHTPASMRGHVTLPDGSVAYMAPDSKITYYTNFGQKNRELSLTGEAFFDVKHDTHRGFIIHTVDHSTVNVLGTSFNVFSRQNHHTEVKVATGLVGVTANNHTWFIKAGLQGEYQPGKELILKKVENKDAMALQNETLYFKKNNVEEIAEKLHRWYNIKFEVSASARKHPRFSGELKDTSLKNLLDALSYATGIKYHYINTNTILLH